MPNYRNVTRPVLIIGPGRSASSWLNDIFAQHGHCRNVIENSIVDDFQQNLISPWWGDNTRFECIDSVWTDRCIQVVRDTLCALFPGSETTWSMKAIWEGHDWDFWRKVFPDARYIHLIREPVASVSSMINKVGGDIEAWKDPSFSCKKYVDGHREAFELRDSGVPYLPLYNEEILRDPDEALGRILEFSGLPADPNVKATNWVNKGPEKERGAKELRWSDLTEECREIAGELGYSEHDAIDRTTPQEDAPQPDEAAETLDSRPWQAHEKLLFKKVPGMLRVHERHLLYFLARDYYTGAGEIVDAGAFAGASAFSLANGLSENGSVKDTAGRIHSFDKWLADEPYLKEFIGRFFDEPRPSEDFDDFYLSNLADKSVHVKMHKGDFLEQSWGSGPIEILFIDIAKTKELNEHAMLEFFPHLIPDRSLVIHQDYHHPVLPYIHVTMEALADYFEIVDEKVDDSIVFRLVKPIPDEVLERAAQYRFSDEEKVRLMDRAVLRLSPENRPHVKLARTFLHYTLFGKEKLVKELKALDREYPEAVDEHWENYRFKMVPRSAGIEG